MSYLFLVLIIIVLFVLIIYREISIRNKKNNIITILNEVLEGNYNNRIVIKENDKDKDLIFYINNLIEELQLLYIKERRIDKERKELLSNISHDIRTPLTSIIGYVDALKDEKIHSTEEKKLYLKILSEKSNSLNRLTEDIFHMAKIDANELNINKEKLDINEITRTTLLEFLPRIEREDITININIPDKSYYIFADRLSVIRILNNIINNALQHGKEGKFLGVYIEDEKNSYKLMIWDKGPGIPSEIIDKIFDRLFKCDDSRNSCSNNHGLGLAITKKLIEQNGGNIKVYSEMEKKTEFILYFQKYKDSFNK